MMRATYPATEHFARVMLPLANKSELCLVARSHANADIAMESISVK
ncbi:MAG: hypothetical protein LBG82_00785 [Clostridiales Family XIII bacterium]|jgi:hypothetical protein|nr:hypothetical protein [Clostridiales Family XIII bacterium]